MKVINCVVAAQIIDLFSQCKYISMIGGDQILRQKRFRKPIFTILKINELQNNFLQNFRKPDNQ